jgi:hypothetical protein
VPFPFVLLTGRTISQVGAAGLALANQPLGHALMRQSRDHQFQFGRGSMRARPCDAQLAQSAQAGA